MSIWMDEKRVEHTEVLLELLASSGGLESGSFGNELLVSSVGHVLDGIAGGRGLLKAIRVVVDLTLSDTVPPGSIAEIVHDRAYRSIDG